MSAFGNFTYHVPRKESDFDAKVRKSMNGEQPTFSNAEEFLENASLEDLKKAANKLAQSDADKVAAQRSQRDADTFVKLHPEFRDTGKNARILRAHCMTAFGTAYPDLEQFETVYPPLRANNLLEINQQELDRQADNEAEARANTIREQSFNEAEAYTLPLDEVRKRAVTGGGVR